MNRRGSRQRCAWLFWGKQGVRGTLERGEDLCKVCQEDDETPTQTGASTQEKAAPRPVGIAFDKMPLHSLFHPCQRRLSASECLLSVITF